MPYNPYETPSSGDYIEIPSGYPPSLVNDYYSAVLNSRQRRPQYNVMDEVMKTLMGLGTGYFQGEMNYQNQQRSAEDQYGREFDKLYHTNEMTDLYAAEKEKRERGRQLEDQSTMGRAMAEWARANQPQHPGLIAPPSELSEGSTIERERPEPIDAILRMAGQYPELAGAFQKGMGQSFSGQMLDPLNPRKKLADIEKALARANFDRTTAQPRADLMGRQGGLAGARTGQVEAQTRGQELENHFRDLAKEAIMNGELDAARVYISLAEGKPWESSYDKGVGQEGGRIDARTDRGLPGDKPTPTRGPTSRQMKPEMAELLRLEALIQRGEASEEDKMRADTLRKAIMPRGNDLMLLIEELKKMRESGGSGGGSQRQNPGLPSR